MGHQLRAAQSIQIVACLEFFQPSPLVRARELVTLSQVMRAESVPKVSASACSRLRLFARRRPHASCIRACACRKCPQNAKEAAPDFSDAASLCLVRLFAYSRARAGVMPMRHARRKCPLFVRAPVRASPALLLEVVGDVHLRPGEGRDRREPDGHLQVGLLLALRQLDHLRYVEGR